MVRGAVRTQELDDVVLYPPKGGPLRLSDLADIREAEGPTKIEHLDRDRTVKLTVNLKDEIALQTAIDSLNAQVIHDLRRDLPLGYSIDVSGQAKDLDRTWEALKWSFLLAVLIIYLLMCSLYESFAYPLVILFSLPPALVGETEIRRPDQHVPRPRDTGNGTERPGETWRQRDDLLGKDDERHHGQALARGDERSRHGEHDRRKDVKELDKPEQVRGIDHQGLHILSAARIRSASVCYGRAVARDELLVVRRGGQSQLPR